ncbi:MAG: 2-oxoglutarate and iron-dependent oxygenase domain-containing protein [Myxococcota bacterium]|nr:2-oxoglutarate and iron-dependent oxygenase domain-containing protein [Myxococcota bacterium]
MVAPAVRLPVIDMAPLLDDAARADGDGAAQVAAELDRACRQQGFFYVVGHGVDPALLGRLEADSRRFFARPEARKQEIAMARGGRAWRGYFPVGAELTSGLPDQKQGLYFGSELPADDRRVVAGLPLHGPNLFPADAPGLRSAVLETLDALTDVGHALMKGLSMALGLAPSYFADHYTRDPLILFRVFHYPALEADSRLWSVGEHTDYGILTLLRQTGPGLEVCVDGEWSPAPPIEGSFLCNIGDMLDRITGGRYRSTPHRVRNHSGLDRLSFPFFFDPAFDARVEPIPGCERIVDDAAERWDGVSVDDIGSTYGDYLLRKVSKVFPELGRDVGIQLESGSEGGLS